MIESCIASRAAALLASATMVVAPAFAATQTAANSIPLSAAPAPPAAWSPADDTANEHRWRRYRRHHDGIDGGDLLGGLLIIGGIAAVAAAIDKDKQERRGDRTQGRDYPYRAPPADYSDSRREDPAYGRENAYDARQADRAVDSCAVEAERSGRVDEIFDVARVGGEWRVKGDYDDGREFTCTFGRNGRAYVGFEDRADSGSWNESSGVDEPDRVAPARAPRAPDGDDRYTTSNSPDFKDPRGF